MNVPHEIDKAISAHELWKQKLRRAIDTGKCESDPEKAKLDNNCAFGKWLYEKVDPSVKDSDYYSEIVSLHAQFHIEAGAILDMALKGSKDRANEMLAADQKFVKCSDALISKMKEWQDTL